MSLTNVAVLCTDQGNKSAKFTVSFADDDHRFTASVSSDDDTTAIVEYEETLSYRGTIRVSEPDEAVFRELMQSNEMTQFLENNDLERVRRAKR